MTDTNSSPRPMHLWIFGLLSLLWNSYGAYDYVMSATRNREHLAQFPPEMIVALDTMPVWVVAAWAIGVWGAVAGSVLLLLRSRFAVHAFALSLLGLAASTFYQFGAKIPEDLRTVGFNAMTMAIWIAAVGFFLYASRMRASGVLR
jgi:hypothetical protein